MELLTAAAFVKKDDVVLAEVTTAFAVVLIGAVAEMKSSDVSVSWACKLESAATAELMPARMLSEGSVFEAPKVSAPLLTTVAELLAPA